jgi:capsule polysaccharide export protein KpsE/RkpR
MERHARHGLGRVEALQAHGPDLPLTDITEQQLDDNTAEFERINKELHIAQQAETACMAHSDHDGLV